jgi:hypothetical protein
VPIGIRRNTNQCVLLMKDPRRATALGSTLYEGIVIITAKGSVFVPLSRPAERRVLTTIPSAAASFPQDSQPHKLADFVGSLAIHFSRAAQVALNLHKPEAQHASRSSVT